MFMTMGVFNKHDDKHEWITLRQRTFYEIIESLRILQFSNDKKIYNIQSYLLNLIQTNIRF